MNSWTRASAYRPRFALRSCVQTPNLRLLRVSVNSSIAIARRAITIG